MDILNLKDNKLWDKILTNLNHALHMLLPAKCNCGSVDMIMNSNYQSFELKDLSEHF